MVVLVCYDVATADRHGRRRLRQVANLCENHGQRVQNSVFECLLEPARWTLLRDSLLRTYDPDQDSLRFYFLGSNWRRRVEHHGAKSIPDPQGPLIT